MKFSKRRRTPDSAAKSSGLTSSGRLPKTCLICRCERQRFTLQDLDLRQARRLIALTTIQNTLAGMKPSCAVRSPITHMMTLLTPARAQPSQHRRPTRIVDATVNTHER